jgi:branched-chain amino acid transport system substrate-binding protein
VGFDTMNSIASALARAKDTDNEKLVGAMRGLKFTSAFGPVEYRAIDHQSTLGAYVGRLGVKDGKGVMVGWSYRDGAKYLPPDEVVKQMRPASA